jgi:hypothetical protein
MMGESQLHVEDLAMSYVDTGKFLELPKVGLIKGDKILVPIDGFHRLHAVKWLASDDFKTFPDAPDVSHLDLTIVEVEIVEFNTIGEAIIAASGVNSDHGMKRKAGDIGTAIAAILEVEPMMFMENKYKLNKRVIMETVKCSSTSYVKETLEMRSKLTSSRNMTIRRLHEEGRSQRDIAGIVGVDHTTVAKIVSGGNYPCVKIHQEEPSENTGDQNTPVAQIAQEPLSAFVHATSVDPILNPFANDNDLTNRVNEVVQTLFTDTTPLTMYGIDGDKIDEVVEAITTKATSKSNVPEEIIKMFNTLPKAQQDEVLLILSDIATEF